MNEKEFTRTVVEMGQRLGWLVFHPLPARVKKEGQETYRTQAMGDPGYPDITMVRKCDRTGECRFIMLELKMPKNKPTDAQADWGYGLRAAGIPYIVLYPDMLDDLEALIR